MRVVVDNNVIIDALKPNPQFEAEAQRILQLASVKEIDGFVNANSLTDIFYVLRKAHGADKAKAMLRKLLLLLDVIGLDPDDCMNALEFPMSDFEDAVVAVCAEKVKADFIVTRDENFIKANTTVKAVTPKQLLADMEDGTNG